MGWDYVFDRRRFRALFHLGLLSCNPTTGEGIWRGFGVTTLRVDNTPTRQRDFCRTRKNQSRYSED